MALSDVDLSWTPDPNLTGTDGQQEVYADPDTSPPTTLRTTGDMTLSSYTIAGVASAGETWNARVVTTRQSDGQTHNHDFTGTVVPGPALAWVSPADGASLTEGDTQTLAVDVTANAHAGAGQVGGITDIRFEYSTDGSTYTEIGTAKCDDTSTPQASLDWTVLTGVTNLRAICVDSGGTEIGTEAVIAVTVTAPVAPAIHDYDFTSDPTTGTLTDTGTSPANLSVLGDPVTAGSDANGAYWDLTGAATVLETTSQAFDENNFTLEIDLFAPAGQGTVTLAQFYGVSSDDPMMLLDWNGGFDRLQVLLVDDAANSNRFDSANSSIDSDTYGTLSISVDAAGDSVIFSWAGTEILNTSLSSEITGFTGTMRPMTGVDFGGDAWANRGGNVDSPIDARLYGIRIF